MSQRSADARHRPTPGTPALTGAKLPAVPDASPPGFDTAIALVTAAYNRDMADATDESDLKRAHDTLLERDQKIRRFCDELVNNNLRESQFIMRVLRVYGHNPEE